MTRDRTSLFFPFFVVNPNNKTCLWEVLILKKCVFGSNRSSRNANLCPFVRLFVHLMQNPSILYVNAKTTALIGPILHKVSFIKMKSSMQHYWLRLPYVCLRSVSELSQVFFWSVSDLCKFSYLLRSKDRAEDTLSSKWRQDASCNPP